MHIFAKTAHGLLQKYGGQHNHHGYIFQIREHHDGTHKDLKHSRTECVK